MSKNSQLTALLTNLPDYIFDFIMKYYQGESINTQHAYALDIKVFLTYLLKKNKIPHVSAIKDIKTSDLEKITLNDLINYNTYLEHYESEYITPTGTLKKVTITNSRKGILRKLSSARSFYTFLFKNDLIEKDITQKMLLPKISHKIKKPLSFKDTIALLNVIFEGEKYFNGKRLAGYLKRKQRDIAIFTTFLGTGIRISELVNLNVEDIDFENESFIVTRKGGNSQEIPMPPQVKNEIYSYLDERLKLPLTDKALFLSNRNSRITVSNIEKMFKIYCLKANVTHSEKTTIHALRRTFACRLLEEGVDLKLVSELMGHKDISVTSKYYAQHNKETHRKVMHNFSIPSPEK